MRFEFAPTKDDYVNTTRSISIKNNEHLWWIMILFYLPMLIFYLVNVVRNPSWFASTYIIFVLFLLGFPPFVFGRIYLSVNKVATQVRANPKLTQLTTWDVDKDEICINNPFGETKLSWETFGGAAENQNYYFLSYAVNKNSLQFVPKRLFDGRGNDETDFRKLLQNKLGYIRSVNVGSWYKISLFILGALYVVTILAFFYSGFRMAFQ